MNKLIMFLFGIVEETIVLHTDDEYYPSQAILTIINRCWVDNIEVVNGKHMYRYECTKKELVSVNITLKTTRKNKSRLASLNRLLLGKDVHMDIKEN
mgnify:FL=1